MDATLVKDIGIKALLVGGAVLVSFWTFNAVKLVISCLLYTSPSPRD